MGSEWTVAELCALRRKAVEEYLRVGEDEESWRLDLRAIDVELDKTLKSAGLTPSAIDIVIRTGGSSLIPAVQALLGAKFGSQKVNKQEVFTSVVQGLALASGSRFF